MCSKRPGEWEHTLSKHRHATGHVVAGPEAAGEGGERGSGAGPAARWLQERPGFRAQALLGPLGETVGAGRPGKG